MSEAFHHKYRPKTFDEIAGEGNQAVALSLQGIIDRPAKKRPHAFLFHGPAGCGKTTFVRIMKTMLGCSDETFYEINASKDRSINVIRQISDSCRMPTLRKDGVRVYLLDEAHQLDKLPQEALLKVLEDCPPHAYFFIATTEPDRIIKAIHTRCTSYQVSLLSQKETRILLKKIAKKEKLNLSDEVAKEIARKAAGSAREAVKLLDQVVELLDDEEAVLKAIASTTTAEEESRSIAQILMQDKGATPEQKWQACKASIKNLREDQVESARIGLLRYFTAVVQNSKFGDKRLISIMELFTEPFYNSGKAGLLVQTMYACYVE